ncbi:MAG TPA: rubrerythrin [Elusimicrobia bacterium]|nr:rubrerythrin [Elusimicrobiota bacterium]
MENKDASDIFAFAIDAEREGEKLYRSLAARSAHLGIRSIFNSLADDEVKHVEVLRQLQQNITPELAKTAVLRGAKNLFADMAVKKDFRAAGDELELYQKAFDMERKSRDFYQARADAAEKGAKDVFSLLAGEESRHMFLIENMIEFISRPGAWLENAEFNHLEEY